MVETDKLSGQLKILLLVNCRWQYNSLLADIWNYKTTSSFS